MFLFAWLAIACSSNPCGEDFTARLDEVAALENERRPTATARAVLDQCGTLPGYVQRALRERVSAPRKGTVGAKLATDRPDVWNEVCPGGQRAVMGMRDGNKAALWAPCNLQRLGAFTEKELATVDAPIVPITVAHFLATSGLSSADVRRTTRMLAGLPVD